MAEYTNKPVLYCTDINVNTIFVFLLFFYCSIFSSDISDVSHFTEVQSLIASQKFTHYKQFGYSMMPQLQNNDSIRSGTYVVINDFIINNHQSITILPDVVLLFEAGKRVIVNGELDVKGNNNHPVVFSNVSNNQSYITTAKNDSLWNGIHVGSQGKIDLRYTLLKNATFGIIASETKDSIAIQGVDFINVGQPHLKIGKNKSLLITPIQPEPDLSTMPGKYSRNMSRIRISTGFSFGIFFIGTLTSALLSNTYYDKASNETVDYKKADEYEKLSNIALTSSVVYGSLALVSALGFSLTFILHSKGPDTK